MKASVSQRQAAKRHTRKETLLHTNMSRETMAPGPSAQSTAVIAVMGATGTGKTTFINLASGSHLRVGAGLESCTDMINVGQPFELDGRTIALIDTPGFDDTTKSDADVLRMIALFLATTYEHGQTLAGVIFIHRISDFRMSGISTRNFRLFRQLCGDSTLKNVVIVTNMWGEVSKEVGTAREIELANNDKFFKPAVAKGAQMIRHANNAESVRNILRAIINNHPLSLRIQREMVDQKKDISQTAAGAELNRELLLQKEKHEEDMKQLREEMKEAIQTKDEEAKQEIEAASKQLQQEINKVQADAQKLVSEQSAEKARMEKRLQELSESYRAEAEERKKAFESQAANLQKSLEAAEQERKRLSEAAAAAEERRRQWEAAAAAEERRRLRESAAETKRQSDAAAARRRSEAAAAAETQRQLDAAAADSRRLEAELRELQNRNASNGSGGDCVIF